VGGTAAGIGAAGRAGVRASAIIVLGTIERRDDPATRGVGRGKKKRA
jgi:hypothetical protein